MRILVVDSHPLFRDGLKAAINATSDLKTVGEASRTQELPGESVRECDVCTVNDEIESLPFIRNVCQLRPKNRPPFVLVCADKPIVTHAVRCLVEGADGYICKAEPTDRILQAIRAVGLCRKFMTPDVAEALLLSFEQKNKPAALSSREYEVIYHLASGLRVSEIALRLNLSVKTVSTYRSRLLEKLDVSNNAGLIRYAVRERIVQVDDGNDDSLQRVPSVRTAPMRLVDRTVEMSVPK